MTKTKTRRPVLSGFCDPPLPNHERHRHCITEACPCPHHQGWPDLDANEALEQLTDDERRAVIAAHLEYHPRAILETVERIIRERTTP